ncbi:unnamed protein product, partial [Effrenium voratum]
AAVQEERCRNGARLVRSKVRESVTGESEFQGASPECKGSFGGGRPPSGAVSWRRCPECPWRWGRQ